MNILAIHDNKAGHKAQINGVLENFSADKVKVITLKANNFFKFLPVGLLKHKLFINQDFKQEISKLFKAKFYPTKIIVIGKRTLPAVLYLKKIMQEQKKPCKIIYLMPPSKKAYAEINLTFFHQYKKTLATSKLIGISVAPHGVTSNKLKTIKRKGIFDCLRKPIITVLIGGDAKKIKFTKQTAKELIIHLEHMVSVTKGTLLVSTSRRTNPQVVKFLQQELKRLPAIYFNYAKNSMMFSGKNINGANIASLSQSLVSAKQGSYNPYLAMLAYADYVVISGESISMISEACALPSQVGVYIFSSNHFSAKRYQDFHDYLYQGNYALPINDFKLQSSRNSLNATADIVQLIKRI